MPEILGIREVYSVTVDVSASLNGRLRASTLPSVFQLASQFSSKFGARLLKLTKALNVKAYVSRADTGSAHVGARIKLLFPRKEDQDRWEQFFRSTAEVAVEWVKNDLAVLEPEAAIAASVFTIGERDPLQSNLGTEVPVHLGEGAGMPHNLEEAFVGKHTKLLGLLALAAASGFGVALALIGVTASILPKSDPAIVSRVERLENLVIKSASAANNSTPPIVNLSCPPARVSVQNLNPPSRPAN